MISRPSSDCSQHLTGALPWQGGVGKAGGEVETLEAEVARRRPELERLQAAMAKRQERLDAALAKINEVEDRIFSEFSRKARPHLNHLYLFIFGN